MQGTDLGKSWGGLINSRFYYIKSLGILAIKKQLRNGVLGLKGRGRG
jgi:hypothetical protein